jgi:hypothetical protein
VIALTESPMLRGCRSPMFLLELLRVHFPAVT